MYKSLRERTHARTLKPTGGLTQNLASHGFEDVAKIQLTAKASAEELEVAIRAIYRQVCGNAYIMESERLVVPDSQFRRGELTVREFVRAIAKSALYRVRFFENVPRYRAIELNFKHLLGRAPTRSQEMADHSQILDDGGFDAEIDAYLDSDEYQTTFGEDIVPYYRGYKTQTGQAASGFVYTLQLLQGASSSDKILTAQNRSRLTSAIVKDRPMSAPLLSGVITPIEPMIWVTPVELAPPVQRWTPVQPTVPPLATTAAPEKSPSDTPWRSSDGEMTHLQKQLAAVRANAGLTEAKLNKWRNRSYSIR